MTQPAGTPMVSSGWQVTGQRPDTQVTASGQLVSGVEVSFLTGHGVAGTVFVPDSQYSAERVRGMIAARAAELDAVSALSAPPAGME